MEYPSNHNGGSDDPISSASASTVGERQRVGLVYDERMCKHSTPTGEIHPENPNRIRVIWEKLLSAGIPQRCVVFDAKEAEDKYIAAVHTNSHINLIKTISSKKLDSQRNSMAANFDSIYFNEGSSEAAYLAAGSVLEVAEKVANGELNSAFAIVRPPGHHAEENEPMGFCLYNNVAVATRFLLNKQELGINKILIVDWDVHHGNGTQKMFWNDSRVLFFSVHRHDYGSFYPTGDDCSYMMIGEGPGAGYNINVPWENGRCGDADYIAVWDHILIPVAREFTPDIIMISAGFDAAIGDPLGGCCVTPYGYSVLLKKLMEFGGGKIVMTLEGGYNLNSLANTVLACVEVLLEDGPVAGPMEVYPFESTWQVIQEVREELSAYWPILAGKLPKKLTSRITPQTQIASKEREIREFMGLQPNDSVAISLEVASKIMGCLPTRADFEYFATLDESVYRASSRQALWTTTSFFLDLQERLGNARSELKDVKGQLDASRSEVEASASRYRGLEKEVHALKEKVAQLEAEKSFREKRISELLKEIGEINRQKNAMKQAFSLKYIVLARMGYCYGLEECGVSSSEIAKRSKAFLKNYYDRLVEETTEIFHKIDLDCGIVTDDEGDESGQDGQ